MPEPPAAARPEKAVQIYLGCSAVLLGLVALLGLFTLASGGLSGQIAAPALGVGVAFLVIGAAGLLLIRWTWVQAALREQRKALAPDKPWSWSQDIRDGVVKGGSSRTIAIVLSLFAAFWVAMMAVVTALGWETISSQAGLAVTMAGFWAAGLFLSVLAFIAVRRALRFGVSNLALDTTPLRLGGWASGVVEGPPIVQGAEVEVGIQCVRRTRGHRSSTSQVLWRTMKVLDGSGFQRRARHVEIPFAILLPADAEATQEQRGVTWHVTVTAKLPGVDYQETFQVPVVVPEPGAASVDARPPREMPELSGDRLMQHLPSRVEYHADADVFVFPLKPALVVWPLALGALAVGVPFLADAPPLAGLPAGVLKWTPIVSAVLAALSVVALLFDPRRIEVRADSVRIRRGVLGIGVHRTLPRQDVAAIVEESSPPLYLVKIRLRNGKSYDVAPTIREPAEAAALATRLRQVLQLGQE